MFENPIFGLVGDSAAGKTKLIFEGVLPVLRESIAVVKSVTTRAPRPSVPNDELSYDFITEVEFFKRKSEGDFVEDVHVGKHFYAYSRTIVLEVLSKRNGICAITEHGVDQLQKAGYPVVPIKIIGVGNGKERCDIYQKYPGREESDQERAKVPIKYAHWIYNRFKDGGFEDAAANLIDFIESYEIE